MANTYELDLIIALDAEGSPKEVFTWVQTLITEANGVIVHTSTLGNKRLAYEIEGKKDGFYGVIYFQAEPSILEELERQLKLHKSVIRYMNLKMSLSAIAELLDENKIKEQQEIEEREEISDEEQEKEEVVEEEEIEESENNEEEAQGQE